jgi:hypothetical protein
MTQHTNLFHRARAWLARVNATPVGRPDDGLTPILHAGTPLDKTWDELRQEFDDVREAWRKNPLARRLASIVTAYVVGDGITLHADDPALSAFIAAFWHHEQNRMPLRQYQWCEELTRSGELFITLHLNRADGMSYVRALPASSIDRVETDPGDYEAELAYHEAVGVGDPDYPAGRTWLSAEHAVALQPGDDNRFPPVCLHFAINRPVGCVRGESDLAPVLPWLKRYSRWLEDRLRLNAAVRAFLWVVRVPGRLVAAKRSEYRAAPEAGSVLVIDRDNEQWEAVSPNLHAADAAMDGRAIRWMVVAGGPGTGLVDVGEAEDANLATARAMGEQRSRFMRARQAYFGHVLASVALAAYNRAVRLGRVAGQEQTLNAIKVNAPDISPDDNGELARAAESLARALALLERSGVSGPAWRRLALRLVLKVAGEAPTDAELDSIMGESGAR